ncbi:efflux RND transporter permease subunit [Terriglobus saanensis]|uniref:Heavy metal efflux pump, CzcA family n=1 Tax=Terriglobus saanensis (strain ATCC BAA-1853 / DSM 23119 / SP1PR4) TaxID=401053 RepID=E8UZW6_TERSS|nr:CusA/CzcA family heavy metal efflux RND transporter [Terriglobus saanensis]ADV81043.1 heavy metal efflux pump, CzcA family [Terriglobus saanensis SP1PR4]
MASLLKALLRYRTMVLIVLAAALAAGTFGALKLDVEAYPDPSPPLVEIITQNPAWSAEEIEQQVTAPIELTLNGTPQLEQIRSISIFGLSDVKLYFKFSSELFRDRQEVLARLQTLQLPMNLQPQLSPWSPIGEIYRYQLSGPYSLNDLKATQDWLVRRELKQVPGVVDITTFGGTTKQYQVQPDPDKLLAYGVTLPQVITAIQSSNANAGGNYLSIGDQNVNVRSIGLLRNMDDVGAVVVAQKNGTPVLVRDVATVKEGFQPRLGKIGRNDQKDIVEAIVLLQKDEQSIPALEALKKKIGELNTGSLLPPGMHISTIYDRTRLIDLTTHTVKHVILTGLFLVTLILLLMLGDLRTTLIAAATIPFAVLFSFSMMALTGHSANLISIGAIDFGILVDASIIVLESSFRRLSRCEPGQTTAGAIVQGVQDAARPVLFSTLIILVAFIPLFTMQGVPGKIFAPMSVTYGFALTGALIFALVFAPVLSDVFAKKQPPVAESTKQTHTSHEDEGTWLSRFFSHHYAYMLDGIFRVPKLIWGVAAVAMIGAVLLFVFAVGGEFMPPLEEGNLWIRVTLPQDISFERAAALGDQLRADMAKFPEITQVVSQVGRPDDGTDVTTFNNLEFGVQLKPSSEWPSELHGDKDKLIEEMQHAFSKYPGAAFGFSQAIQDNVEEAMSGVKGENSLKLFGDNLDDLTRMANQIQTVMEQVRGVTDVGIFKVNGQPSMVINLNREHAARYGISPSDVNAAIQAAVGGSPITQMVEGDRRFDIALRYPESDRSTPEAVGRILLPTPDGGHVSLSQVADVAIREGSFMIYREGGRRYIPIKFSVRGRDLSATIEDLQHQIHDKIKLPQGYSFAWAGEFDSLRKEQQRLAVIIPISLLVIFLLLYLQFQRWVDALIVLATLPFCAIGGILGLLITHTSFSISAAVGFTSLIGVATLAAVVFLSGIRRTQRAHPHPKAEALRIGALDELRPVMMACLSAGLGLLPAAVMNGIGAQAQQPLARVVVGGMVTTVLAVLFLIPLMTAGTKPAEVSVESE